MSVKQRKTTAGLTKEYHYRFMVGGKPYAGVCVGCETVEDAIAYEAKIKKTVSELSSQRNVKALVENFRDELAGGKAKIKLVDAFDEAMKKPRRHSSSDSHLSTKQSQFGDFVSYMAKKHPDIIYISDVTKRHSESYISYLRSNGRFNKTIVFKNANSRERFSNSRYTNRCTQLSPSTINRAHKTLREVFGLLVGDSGLENVFASIPMMSEDQESREAFTEAELELIVSKAPDFIRSIFVVGFFTAFREGDIATLRWSDVLWDHGVIRKRLLKTGVVVEVPIMPPLLEFLKSRLGDDDEFVLPDHAAMYRDNPSGISYRVKKFLEEVGIVTTKAVSGRTRAVSVKDVHSLRHTFCYFAGVAGIPLVVVQSIVGHMTPEMTSHYTAHADRKAKRDKLSLLPGIASMTRVAKRRNLIEQKKAAMIEMIKAADDDVLSRVEAILLPAIKPARSLRIAGSGKPK